jgi:ribosomal protein S18 acetylase RimI-like enzyme
MSAQPARRPPLRNQNCSKNKGEQFCSAGINSTADRWALNLSFGRECVYMEKEFIIRNANPNNYQNITQFLRKMMIDEMEASGGYPVSKDDAEWEKYFQIIKNNQNNQEFVYKIADIPKTNKLVGVCEARITNRFYVLEQVLTLHIHSLYVEKEYRRKGIGKELMVSVIKWGQENKCKEAELDVFVSNKARTLYEQMGFRPFELKMVRKL